MEAGAQSPDDEPMDRDPDQSQGLAYEFEVKEQDRWLPIANGKSFYSSASTHPVFCQESHRFTVRAYQTRVTLVSCINPALSCFYACSLIGDGPPVGPDGVRKLSLVCELGGSLA